MLYSIEGNIGVGKSTLISVLTEKKYSCYKEPVEKWTLLEKFYKDPVKYMIPFQNQVLLTQICQLNEIKKDTAKIKFVERSIWTARNIFIEMNIDKWDETNLDNYDLLYNSVNPQIDVMFFLKSDPQTCFDRVSVRNRPGEEKITLSYLENLNNHFHKTLTSLDLPFSLVVIQTKDKTPLQIADEIEKFVLSEKTSTWL